MSMYPRHGMGAVPPATNTTRLNELLEQVRAEFDGQIRQTEHLDQQSTLPPLSLPTFLPFIMV